MDNIEMKPTERQIVHLILNTCRLLGSRADRAMEEFGLFRGQAILLLILSDHDGMTHSEIAAKLEISPAAATKVIKRVEAMDYLQRTTDPADERVSRVFLKEEGWAVARHIKEAFRKNDLALVRGLSEEEKSSLISLLLRMHANLSNPAPDSS